MTTFKISETIKKPKTIQPRVGGWYRQINDGVIYLIARWPDVKDYTDRFYLVGIDGLIVQETTNINDLDVAVQPEKYEFIFNLDIKVTTE